MTGKADALRTVLASLDRPLVAVSGGVDSMTLAHFAHRETAGVRMVHALSPAVPQAGTARVRQHAERHGWDLQVADAGEFADPRYRANPVNRCYFCKTNLYGALAGRFGGTILSGTNTDDLGDFRPGLQAASEHGARHPFVEAGMSKDDVRALARGLGLGAIAELPASPCLSSRVETGIGIAAEDLALIDRIETDIRTALGPGEIRCRVVAGGVRIELDPAALAGFTGSPGLRADIEAAVAAAGHRFLGAAPYRRGSAFLRQAAHG